MIVIIDYGIGNTGSVVNALNKLGIPNRISSDPEVLNSADGLILPGVGNAQQGMENLRRSKLDQVISEAIQKGKPFLGICLGMQLLFETSEEGNTTCLGILKGAVYKFQQERKVPQIGWNEVKAKTGNQSNRLFFNIPNQSLFYFVNSYYCMPSTNEPIIAKSSYGETFASVVARKNLVATQFHPEKSGRVGFQLLSNFNAYYVKGENYEN
ncbi:imidazole glycerol phosphate synthase subunit HisH [Candidatus Microgenomates bacterium]|nr:MAG: imidazole glycerol phosphate synthase subunit HisH [Candidatus Microgenomates bacterium]